MRQKIIFILFATALLISPAAFSAKPPVATASALLPSKEVKQRVEKIQDLDATYTQVTNRLAELNKQLPGWLKHSGRNRSDRTSRLTTAQATLLKEYKDLKDQKYFLEPIYGLKQAINKTYLDVYPNPPMDELNAESSRLALGLAVETARLREVYNSISMPIVQNMMISIKVRQRGACKHWAEDLLAWLSQQPRKFFSVTWGQAHAAKFTEHNTAVIFPIGSDFQHGLLVDPWRTSGKLFWVGTTKDPHYPWKHWEYYGIQ